MFRKIITAGVAVLVLAIGCFAQEKKKEVIVNSDGSYTVIEYPVGKEEVVVNLTPATTVATAKGIARVMRSADGTKIYFDMSELPATVTSYHAYAVDPAGATTYLGPLTITNGVAKAEFSTALNQFMLVVSPMEGLTAITPANTVFTSAIPTGYAVVPRRTAVAPIAEVAGDVRTRYNVPMLNISTFPDTEKELKVKFGGELSGLEGKAYIDREDGVTKVRMKFDDIEKLPAGKHFTLWSVSPDFKYTRLGTITSTGERDEAEIVSETNLTDFGLFVTAEDTAVTVPTSRTYTVIKVDS